MDRASSRDPQGSPAASDVRGVIRTDELFTLNELKHRLGISNATLRSARRAGLRVYYKHKHAYGRDWIEYVMLSGDCKKS